MSARDYFKKNRMLGLFIAVLIHSALIFGLATITFKIAVPEGIVTSEPIEMTAITEGGSTVKNEIKTEKITVAPVPSPETDVSESIEEESAEEDLPEKAVTALPAKEEPKDIAPKEPVAKVLPVKKEMLPEKKKQEPSKFVGVQELPKKEEPIEKAEEQEELIAEDETQNLSQLTSSDPSQKPDDSPGIEDAESDTEEAGFGEPEGEVQSASVLTPMEGNKNPSYPAMSRFKRHQGTTVIRFQVDDQGRVTKAWVQESSGHSELDQASLERVSEWKFYPGRTGTFEKPFHFLLKGRAEEIRNDPRYKTKDGGR